MISTILQILSTPIAGLVTLATEYLAHKRRIKELKQEAEIKQIENEMNAMTDADSVAVEDGKKSWKDEYITLIVTLPVVGTMISAAFFPESLPNMVKGWKALELIPEWYVILYTIVVLSVMGARIFHKYVLPRIKK